LKGSQTIYRKFVWAGLALIAVLVIGAIGFWFVGGRQHSIIDVIYMTVITISTIGFAEIIDLSGNPAGRAFTILIALAGIGILFYIVTSFTALIVEGQLTDVFRRRRMEKKARNYKDHYIVCGIGLLGSYIANELQATRKQFVVVDTGEENLNKALETFSDCVAIAGDATDNDVLLKTGIKAARGLFAVTNHDNKNIVICLTAKQLNPDLRVVARCNETRNSEKLYQAGANAVVSPHYIGGLRMASEMIRPTVVSFLDIMLRDKERNLRIEEIPLPDSFVGKPISVLELKKYPAILLLAVRTEADWIYNPPDNYIIEPKSILIFLTTPKERSEIEKIFAVSN